MNAIVQKPKVCVEVRRIVYPLLVKQKWRDSWGEAKAWEILLVACQSEKANKLLLQGAEQSKRSKACIICVSLA